MFLRIPGVRPFALHKPRARVPPRKSYMHHPPVESPKRPATRPAVFLQTPRALAPPRLHRMVGPPGALVARLRATFPRANVQTVWMRIAPICEQIFPTQQARSIGDVTAYQTLAFGMQACRAQVENPEVQRFIDIFEAVLGRATLIRLRNESLWALPAPQAVTAATALVRDHIVKPLSQGLPILMEGGYQRSPGPVPAGGTTAGTPAQALGHAVAVYLTPQPDGNILCGLVNRADGEAEGWHPVYGRRHILPIVFTLQSNRLVTKEAQNALIDILALQHEAPGHDIDAFYRATYRLLEACDGHMLLGKHRGINYGQVIIPGMSAQKETPTCPTHSVLGALHFALHAHFGTLLPSTPPATRALVQQHYKTLKYLVRGAVLDQVLDAYGRARTGTDAALTETLHTALLKTERYLAARVVRKPHLRTLWVRVREALKTA